MRAAAARIPVARIVEPRSLAIIGASENLEKFGGRILHNVLRHGFAGRVFPINPNRKTLLGLEAYPGIAAAPGPIDLAVVAVPGSQLLATVEECAAAGVGACVVVTAQLAEFDAAGAALQARVVEVARACGMRLVGPNCMGMINPANKLALSSTMTLAHVERLRTGGVALVSQSGALMATVFIHGHDHGVGFSRMISVGNQADLESCDFLEYLIDDPATKTICLYVEALAAPQRFVDVARRAFVAGKTLLAVKAGRTAAGGVAARSHTASLVGSYEAFTAACRAAGVIVTDEPEGMILAAGVIDRTGPIGPGGAGLIVSSGGGGAVTADRMMVEGLPLASWNEATRARLARHFLPSHINNPMDLGAHRGALGPQVFADTIDAVVEAPEVAVLMYTMTPQPLMEETAEALIRARRRTEKPIFVVLDTSSFAPEIRARFIDAGLPVMSRIDDGLRAIRAMIGQRSLRELHAAPPAARPPGAGPASADLPQGQLTESEAKRLLAAYGIPAPKERPARSADEAAAAAAAIGYPVVMKGVSRRVVHKSDAGLVKLTLGDAEAVRDAYAAIERALAAAAPGEPAVAVVMEQAAGEVEMILGARWDPGYGAQVLVGFGGVLVDLLKDTRLACAPLSRAQARALIEELAMRRVLDGVRGRPAADSAALADALVRLSWLAHDLGPRMREMDVNPLVVRAAGRGVLALDARATVE